jgi:outer membrane protein assembly factor BamD
MKSMFNIIGLITATLALSACSAFEDEDKTAAVEKPQVAVAVLYNQARDKLSEKSYKAAIADFEEVERQYPYDDLAIRAQVMSGFTSYKAGDYDTAISTLERFTKMHPGDASVPYAYYLIALCYYEQISDVGRDQKMTEKALAALTEVTRRFPETDYARDAKLKLDLTYDHLAGKEMEIGRYYQSKDEYLAAINRFRYVIENYQTTSHVPEALHRLVEIYTKMGVPDEAKRYAAVLGHNYPSSIWYRDSYQIVTGEKVGSAKETKDEGWLDGLLP